MFKITDKNNDKILLLDFIGIIKIINTLMYVKKHLVMKNG